MQIQRINSSRKGKNRGRGIILAVPVVIAPYDMRRGRCPELEQSELAWYPALLDEIQSALKAGTGK